MMGCFVGGLRLASTVKTRSVLVSVLVWTSFWVTAAEGSGQQLEPRLLSIGTVVPIAGSIASELAQNTRIEVIYLPSKRYSIKRIPAWIKRLPLNEYPLVDAVVSIHAAWPLVNAYPAFRANNIATTPIDLAEAFVPSGERVVTLPSHQQTPSYFWLNPGNAQLMIGTLKRDLEKLLEHRVEDERVLLKQKELLGNNAQRMVQAVRDFQLQLEEKALELEVMQVSVTSLELLDLAVASLMPIEELNSAVESDLPTLLLTNRKPGHKSLNSLPDHVVILHVDDFSKPSSLPFSQRWVLKSY